MPKIKVLFLCTGNSARSQMAEALLRHFAGDLFEVFSAGLGPQGIHPLTTQVMKEIGISLADHYSKPVGEYMGKTHFGYLITVCSAAEERCPAVFPGISQRLHWPFDDPAACTGPQDEKLQKFREVRDDISRKIQTWLAEFQKDQR
ncbi:arsenate reductase [Syntrophus gentianae]|uniref:Arsenate reductase n=1 Tax=Syntrophus gentianae TaxID=43775 RepID=A0A1H7WX68_9BACT|nr:arsenate reductase ArsC [Syntrophus gentianae]SEM25459.1 arsenate reductase [Syntrophus gentianae]